MLEALHIFCKATCASKKAGRPSRGESAETSNCGTGNSGKEYFMTELRSEGAGIIRIADEVLAVIAGTAALEAGGVAGIAGYLSNDVNNKAVRKHMIKGVGVKVTGDSIAFNMLISVKFGVKLQDVSREVQQRVKGAIETMTGLAVSEVNVNIGALVDENKRRM